jgi:molybdate transport system regulatory protein
MKKIASRISPIAKPTVRVLLGDAIAIGPGKAALLDAVDRMGSISGAARHLGMSYRQAWLLVDTMNSCFSKALVESAAGGPGGGGARITEFGHEVLRRYRAIEKKAEASIAGDLNAFATLMQRSAPRRPRSR